VYAGYGIETPVLSINVSPKSLERAGRFMNDLINVMGVLGFDIACDLRQQAEKKTAFALGKDRVAFEIEEISTRSAHVPTPQEKKQSFHQNWDFTPSGKLVLTIAYVGQGYQVKWGDSPGALLEAQLPNIVAGFVKAWYGVKVSRIELEKREEKANLQRQWRDREEKLVAELHEHIEGWETSKRIEAYLNAFEANHVAKHGAVTLRIPMMVATHSKRTWPPILIDRGHLAR